MYKIDLETNNKSGLHAQPVKELVAVLSQYNNNVEIEFNNKTVDGKSIMGILSLGIGYNQTFSIILDGGSGEAFYRNKLEYLFKRLHFNKIY